MTSSLNTREVKSGAVKAQSKRYLIAIIPAAFVLLANALSFAAPQEPTAAVAPDLTATALPPAGTLNFPAGLAVDGLGQVYVANLGGGGITVYSKSLKLVGTITENVYNPVAVSVAPSGLIYVANTAPGSYVNISVFRPSLQAVNSTYDPSLRNPIGMFVDGSGDVWVLDSAGTLHLYLEDLTPSGTVDTSSATTVAQWGTSVSVWGCPDGWSRSNRIGWALHKGLALSIDSRSPRALGAAPDALGQEYLTVPSTNQVQIFTNPNSPEGVTVINTVTTGSFPYGIAVDSINKRFYVSEPDANLVAVYSTVAPYKLIGTIR